MVNQKLRLGFYKTLTPTHVHKAREWIKEIKSEGNNKKEALRNLRNLYFNYVPKKESIFHKPSLTCKDCDVMDILQEWGEALSRYNLMKSGADAK